MEPIAHYCFLSRICEKDFFSNKRKCEDRGVFFFVFFLRELAFLFSLLIDICFIEYTIKEHTHLFCHKTHTIFAKKRVTVIIITLLLTLPQPLCAIFNFTCAELD